MRLKWLLLSISIITTSSFLAQSEYEIGFLPEFNFGTSFSKVWSLDAEVAARFESLSGSFGENNTATSVYFDLVDVTTVFNRTVGVDAKVGFGYLARFRDEEGIHRLIQQYAFTNPYYGFRIGHRFRVDETFAPNETVETRLRYRVSSDISLNGEYIDPKELYLKVGNEYVYSFQGSDTDLEIRMVPTLGYYLDDDHKIEVGIDYRIDSFINTTIDHRIWLNVGYYLNL
jgi:hypothetical protein